MKKISEDVDLRQEVKRKCSNDWNLTLTEDQITSCLVKMEKTKLSLFHGQIWPNVRSVRVGNGWEKRVTWAISIDGYRAIAHRNGLAGIDEPNFITADDGRPIQASIRVYRIHHNVKSAYVGSARYSEFVQMMDEYDDEKKKTGRQIPNHQWQKSPFNQLAMAAERQALRRGFQETIFDDEVSEVYDPAPVEIEDASSTPFDEPEMEGGEEDAPVTRKKASKKSRPAKPPAAVAGEIRVQKSAHGGKVPDLQPLTEAKPRPAPEPVEAAALAGAVDPLEALKAQVRPLIEKYKAKHHPNEKLSQKYIRQIYKDLLGVIIPKGQELAVEDLEVLRDTLKDEMKS